MKLSDVEEVRNIGNRLEAVAQLRSWLDSWPTQGLKIDANGLMTKVALTHETSQSLLDEVELACIKRLRELGVEP